MSNAIVAQKQRFSVAITTDTYKDLINNTLGDPARSRRFIAAITSAVAVNPALQECTPQTIIAGALLGESMNLSPSPQLGRYYLVPFESKIKGKDGKPAYVMDENGKPVKDEKGKWKVATEKKAQFVMGYKGYIELAIRSGQYKDMDAFEIREGEYLGKDPETGKPKFRFIVNDEERESRPVIGYLAFFEYLNGFRKTLYWPKNKMMNHANDYSKAFSASAMQLIEQGKIPQEEMWKYSSFWYKDFDGMAKKTMLRQLISRWGIMSIEMQQAFENDSAVIRMNEDGSFAGDYDDPADPQAGQDEPPEVPDMPPEVPGDQISLADL